MDLNLYWRVIWRFRALVAGGLALALLLAVASVAKPNGAGLSYRSPETFESKTTLFVTQGGFPWGRSVLPVTQTPQGGAVSQYADTTRFSSLAILYSHLANGNEVGTMLRRGGPLDGTFVAAPVPSDDGNGFIPFIDITAHAPSAIGARRLAGRASTGLQRYIANLQQANGIKASDRVQLRLVTGPTQATVFEGHKLTKPVAIFLLIAILTLGIAFMLENLRPSARAAAAVHMPVLPEVRGIPAAGEARRSA